MVGMLFMYKGISTITTNDNDNDDNKNTPVKTIALLFSHLLKFTPIEYTHIHNHFGLIFMCCWSNNTNRIPNA